MAYQDPLEKTMMDFNLERVLKYIGNDERSISEIARDLKKPVSVIHYWLNHKSNTKIVQSNATKKWRRKHDLDFLFRDEEKMQVMREILERNDEEEIKDYMQYCLDLGTMWLGRFDFYAEFLKKRWKEQE